ncbi:MAG: serpin family protein [Gemmatimonadetes bacterium]|nr:serpin family protein [Gemmatimonadota bacterium]
MPTSLRIGTVGLLVVGSAMLAACDLFTGPDGGARRIDRLPRALTVSEQQVIARSNEFAFRLLREVYQREQTPNVFISPLSASMALGMTLNGAATTTFDSMRAALGFQGLTQDEINRSYHDLTGMLLELDPKVELRIANSTWARQGVPFVPAFFTAVSTWFDAEAREVNFGDPATVGLINAWAADHTNDRIRKVLDRITPDQFLFLLNAVYFKGDWTNRFDAADTRPSPFRLANGQSVQVTTMFGELKAAVSHSPGVLIGELPYGGQAFVLTIAIPQGNATLAELIASLDATQWAQWTSALPSGDYDELEAIHVGLPKLQLEYETMLKDALTALGMGVAFDPQHADFSRMTPAQAYIDFVKQNTFLKMDEKGTEAAAVTTVGMAFTSLPPSLTVDRPYLIAIRERLSGTILFLGAIGDPR